MAKPKFYLEPRPTPNGQQAINMFYSFAGQRLQYYTGIRIEIKYFRPECNTSDVIKPIKTIAPDAAAYNQRLKDIKTDAIRLVNDTKGDNLTVKYIREQLDLIYKPKPIEPQPQVFHEEKHDLVSYFEKIISDCKCGKRVLPSGKNKGGKYSHNAIKNYGISLSAIKRYLEYNKLNSLPFDAVNRSFYEDFRTYCFDLEDKEVSTFAGYVKDIKTIMKEATPETFNPKHFITPGYEADTLYLTVEQIDNIANLDLSDYSKFHTYIKKKQSFKVCYQTLDKVRDLYLIGSYTGLRFSDFSNLDVKSIDKSFIKLKQTKTGDRVTIPIMSKLRPVLNKYPNTLPTISNQKFNDYIKHVAQLAGLTENRTISNTKGNNKNEITSPLYSLVTSHCCRRSYATNMFKAGVPPMLIMSATGHKTETSFLKYIRANNEDKAKLLAETLQKLGL